MNLYRIIALHKSGRVKSFKVQAEDIPSANAKFHQVHPDMSTLTIEFITEDIPKIMSPSKAKRRGYFKARLCQIRANLRSMTDDESGLLTQEEVIQLQRITCKVDRVVALFTTRTLDLTKSGML